MSEKIQFEATLRNAGKSNSRKARVERSVPTVVYGPKMKNTNIFLNETMVKKFSAPRFESKIFTLKSDAKEINELNVLFKDIQFDPVTVRPVHVDLYALDMTKPVRVNVHINFSGVPIGVKEAGALLQPQVSELTVECLPADIPAEIVVDVTDLNNGDAFHAGKVVLPDNVKCVTAKNITLCIVAK